MLWTGLLKERSSRYTGCCKPSVAQPRAMGTELPAEVGTCQGDWLGDCQDTKGRRQSSTPATRAPWYIRELAGENCLESPESTSQHQSAKVTGPIFFHQSQKLPTQFLYIYKTWKDELFLLSQASQKQFTISFRGNYTAKRLAEKCR